MDLAPFPGMGARLRPALFVAVLGLTCVVSMALASRASAYVYWSNSPPGTIGRANLDGTGVNQSFITGANNPYGVASDGTHVYWANQDGAGISGNQWIGRANTDGSGVNQNLIRVAAFPWGVAVDRNRVYEAQAWYSGFIGTAGLDGSGANGVWIDHLQNPTGLAVDRLALYWTSQSLGTIGRANLDGTGVNQSFITGADNPYGVASDGTHIYWTNSNGTIGRANLDGSRVDQSFITGANNPTAVAVDDLHLYWTNYNSGTIGRSNLDGSGVNQAFITGANGPHGLAVDALVPTTMRVDCLPGGVLVGGSTACTATVTDQTTNPSTPSGTVTFTTSRGSLSASSCTLTPGSTFAPPGAGLSASCAVLWYPPSGAVPGQNYSVDATYNGDRAHSASSAGRGFGMVAPGAVPELTNVTQSATRWTVGSALPHTARAKPPVGTTFGFTLNRPARVQFLFTYTTIGRRVGGRCVPHTNRNRRRARCLLTVRSALSRPAHTGRTRLHFEGRLDRKRKLPAGRYRLIIIATANGYRSNAAILRFTILR